MSGVGFAGAGYIAPPCPPTTVTINVTGEIVGTLVAETDEIIGTLIEDCAAPAFEISSFAASTSVVEIGTIVATPAFTASYNFPPTSAALTNDDNAEDKDVTATATLFTSDQSYQKTAPNGVVAFTLLADNGGPADNAAASISWRANLTLFTSSSPGPYTDADVLASSQVISLSATSGLFDVTLNPDDVGAGGEYLVARYHDDFNGAVPGDFEVGNFGNGDATEINTGVSNPIPNGTALFSFARSDFKIQLPAGIRWARET